MGKDGNRDLYRVAVSGRHITVTKVGKTDPDRTVALETATVRMTEAMHIMREQEADPTKLDATHYFWGLDAAKDFARMAFKNITESLDETWKRMERYDGRTDP